MSGRSAPGPVPLRPDIADSWRRAASTGLQRGSGLDRLRQTDVDPGSRLVAAAAPVLDRLAAQLHGTRYCVLLADRDARIVQRRAGQAAVERALDAAGAVLGAVFDEASTGTNSIATVHELRRGVRVVGDEHYLEAMRGFTCYGHPVVDPLTRRYEGVLDLTGPVEDTNDLLAPFLTAAVEEVQQRLRQGARQAQQSLLSAFQAASRRTTDAVLVLGEGVCLADRAATTALAPQDHVVLRALAEDGVAERGATAIQLASGHDAEVRLTRVAGDGVLVHVALGRGRLRTSRRAAPVHRGAAVLLVLGEPGSGRTTAALARAAAAGGAVHVVDAPADDPDVVSRVVRALRRGDTVVVENLHAAGGPVLECLRQLCSRPLAGRLVATADASTGETGQWVAVRSTFAEVREIPPLRARRAELPALADALLRELEPGSPRRLAPELLELLVRQPWPGNLHELRAVLSALLAASDFTTLGCAHLPAAYRRRDGARRGTPLQEAERAAILTALEVCAGNKVATARRLGISRGTLYSRIRTLGILA